MPAFFYSVAPLQTASEPSLPEFDRLL